MANLSPASAAQGAGGGTKKPTQLGFYSEPEVPDVMTSTLSPSEQADLRANLSSLLMRRSPSPRPDSPSAAPKMPNPADMPKLPPPGKMPPPGPVKKSPSPSPAAARKAQEPAPSDADLEVEHLLKPSAVKQTQPTLESVVGGQSPMARSPTNVTKEALLSQLAALADSAEAFQETEIIKCSLPEAKRPTERENPTDVDDCIRRAEQNDPTLTDVNLNNLKRTPIPHIQRLIETLRTNTHLKSLSLANLGLTDSAFEPILEILQVNSSLQMLNIETNFLSGDFLARLFQACVRNESLNEVKAVNQSQTFSSQAEMNIMKAIYQNKGLWKVSLNLRLPEARQKVDQALIRNGDIRRLKRQLEAMEVAQQQK